MEIERSEMPMDQQRHSKKLIDIIFFFFRDRILDFLEPLRRPVDGGPFSLLIAVIKFGKNCREFNYFDYGQRFR